MKKRGISILWAMSLTALFFTLALAGAVRLDQARQQTRTRIDTLRARSLAASGCRFARAQLARGAWKGHESFRSPEMDGHFDLQLQRQGARVNILCHSWSGEVQFNQQETYP